jgi:hypothetical protein
MPETNARCPIKHSSGERCYKDAGHEGNHGLDPKIHRCHTKGCTVAVKPEMLMCLRHWRLVPKTIQREIWRTYRPGQCDDRDPSRAWHDAADAAIRWVAEMEGCA